MTSAIMSITKKVVQKMLSTDFLMSATSAQSTVGGTTDARGSFLTKEMDSKYTVKTGLSFRHLLRHKNSASTSVVSALQNVCLSVKMTLRLYF
jgi:hypothetical protein